MNEPSLEELTKRVTQLLADNKALRAELERVHREREAQFAGARDVHQTKPVLSDKPLPESPPLPDVLKD